MRRDKIKYGDRITYEDLNGNTLTIIAGKSFDGMNLADFTIKLGNVKSIERPHYQKIYSREILDTKEKEYLSAVIRPFKKEIKYIRKNILRLVGEYAYIEINLGGEAIVFPNFKKGTMYKNMKPNKKYTLKELGL